MPLFLEERPKLPEQNGYIRNIIGKKTVHLFCTRSYRGKTHYCGYIEDESYELGKGGFGTVYKGYAFNPYSGQFIEKFPMVIKKIAKEDYRAEEYPFTKVSYRCLPPVEMHTDEGEFIALFMEYLPGVTLTKYLAEKEPDFFTRLQLISDIVEDCNRIHCQGLMHADVRADNIFVMNDKKGVYARFIDFGNSAQIDDSQIAIERDVQHLKAFKSPGYCAPENIQDQFSAASDVFMLVEPLLALLGVADVAKRKQNAAEKLLERTLVSLSRGELSAWYYKIYMGPKTKTTEAVVTDYNELHGQYCETRTPDILKKLVGKLFQSLQNDLGAKMPQEINRDSMEGIRMPLVPLMPYDPSVWTKAFLLRMSHVNPKLRPGTPAVMRFFYCLKRLYAPTKKAGELHDVEKRKSYAMQMKLLAESPVGSSSAQYETLVLALDFSDEKLVGKIESHGKYALNDPLFKWPLSGDRQQQTCVIS